LKKHKRFIFYILILLIILSVVYFYPKNFNKEYNGVIYKLGDNSYSENIKISFDGYLSKQLFKGDKFQGTINIGNKKFARVFMEFSNRNDAFVQYYDENLGEYKIYGDMVSSNIKDRFIISVWEAANNGGSTWSSKNGLVVSAPANCRSEALDISNKLMKNFLNGVELK
jgi:hypothetical protein